MNDPALDVVIDAEMRLLLPEVRASRQQLEDLLAHDFAEVGASGRHWSREKLIEELLVEPQLDDIAVADPVARRVGSDVIQVSYVTVSGSRSVIRTSWWRATDATWRCFFHQGTVDPVGN